MATKLTTISNDLETAETISVNEEGRSGGSDSGTDQVEAEILAKNEKRALFTIRLLTFFVLLSAALALCLSVFYYTSANEQNAFETAFEEQASKLINTFSDTAMGRVKAMTGFASNIKSHARFANATWPMVSLPEFGEQAKYVTQLASIVSLVLIPVVHESDRGQWETYSVANQGWIADELALLQQRSDPSWTRPSNWTEVVGNIPPTIVDLDGYETAEGPWTPTW